MNPRNEIFFLTLLLLVVVTGLGVPDMVIQRILRHANVSTTATYYIKTAADDVRNAMAKLEQNVPLAPLRDTFGTVSHDSRAITASVN